MEETKKSCGMCSHHGTLVNQGMWWCNAGHTENMDPETCGDYDGAYEGKTEMTSMSILSNVKVEPYFGPNSPKPMAKYKIARAKTKRKKERGVKHGKRK